eukprot:3971386-Amphidinium_carterae.1
MGAITTLDSLTKPPLKSMVVDALPASVDANMPVTIQTNRVAHIDAAPPQTQQQEDWSRTPRPELPDRAQVQGLEA